MGKIDRLKRITMARIEAYLDTLEKPEYILPQLVKEMTHQFKEAAGAKAKALSAVKGARRRLDEASGKVLRLENGAKLAIQVNDMDTARQAVAAQIDAEKQLDRCRTELETAEKAYHSAAAVCTQLAANLDQLKEKKTSLLNQHRRQQLSKQLQEKYTPSVIQPGDDILDAVARMETKVEQQQIELEVQSELAKTLGIDFREERVKQLECDAEVDHRLSEMKKRIDKK
jgi:phage shock protein A